MFLTARAGVSFRPERPVFLRAREANTGREVEESLFDRSRKPGASLLSFEGEDLFPSPPAI